MKHFLAIAFILSISTTAVLAQDAPAIGGPARVEVPEEVAAFEAKQKAALKVDVNTEKERLELSQEMHKIWPIRQKIEGALDSISERIPEKDRLKFKSGMRRAIDFEQLESASIKSMAEIYTVAELNKMIGFYGSKEGRSISVKTGDYEKQLQPLMVKMVDKALLDAKMGSSKSGAQSLPR